MKPSQEKIRSMSKKISIVLKSGFIVSNVIIIVSLIAIGILVFSGEDTRSSFLAAFNVTANNGTTICIEARSLLIMFAFMLILLQYFLSTPFLMKSEKALRHLHMKIPNELKKLQL